MSVPNPTPIYHVSHVRNLSSILDSGGVLSHHEMTRRKVGYQNIAYDHIQDRRETTLVFGAQGGCLHDYVPFHFAPKSPMLFTISKGNVPSYTEGQAPLIYLVATAQNIAAADISFAFTDGHATMRFTEFFFDLAKLNRVDWSVMQSRYWFDSDQYPDRKRRRQAEFLVYKQFPVELVKGIAVNNARVQAQVLEILSGFGVELPVQIKPEWYY